KKFYPINKSYYYAAIQQEIMMSIVFLPNLYYLYVTLSDTVFKKRPLLKKTILIFTILNILYIINTITAMSYYLNGYFNDGLIRVETCFYIRRTQMLLLTFLVTFPLVFTVHRYFTVFSQNSYQNYICIVIFIVSNIPSFTLFAAMFLKKKNIWVPDEVCTFIRVSSISGINKIVDSTYYVTLGVPLIVGIINVLLIRRLSKLSKTSSVGMCKRNENKTVFINLFIQTFQPFIGQWPSILFYYYLVLTQNNIYLVWRIIDALIAISLVLNIFFSMIFIKDVRNAVFRKIGIKYANTVTMANNNIILSKSKNTIMN
uniref:Uncharacterized protein n=2 Tax=Strongyloides stercoralis TaxID=6248 RepID=A0AAF5CZ68_STRER